jgi:hypothetical protein
VVAAHQHGRWDVAKLEGGPNPAPPDTIARHQSAGVTEAARISRRATRISGDYRDTVRRGLEFLLNAQDRRGSVEGDARLFAKCTTA